MKAEIQAAKRARKGIEQIRKQLVSPTTESVHACAGPLSEAMRCMEMLQAELRQLPSRNTGLARELGPEVLGLRKELSQVTALLQSAAEFNEGYGRLLRSHMDVDTGYSRLGAQQYQPEARTFIFHG